MVPSRWQATCLSLSVDVDLESGEIGITGEAGIGTPGISGGVDVSTGSVGDPTVQIEGECGAGIARGAIDTNGDVSAGAGTALSTPYCSATAGYSASTNLNLW